LTVFAPNFVPLLSRVLSINVLFLSKITSRIRNWRSAKVYVRILQLHAVICYVMSRSEQLLANFLKKTESLAP